MVLIITDRDLRMMDGIENQSDGTLRFGCIILIERDCPKRREYAESILGSGNVHIYSKKWWRVEDFSIQSFVVWYLRHGSCMMIVRTNGLPCHFNGYPVSNIDISKRPIDRGLLPHSRLIYDVMYVFRDSGDAAHRRDVGLIPYLPKPADIEYYDLFPGNGRKVSEMLSIAGNSVHHVMIYDWNRLSILNSLVHGDSEFSMCLQREPLAPIEDFNPEEGSKYGESIVIGYRICKREHAHLLTEDFNLSVDIPWLKTDDSKTGFYERNRCDAILLTLVVSNRKA